MSVHVKHTDEILKYKILNVLEFTSFRKRMSIITQDVRTQRIILFSKGADNVILSMLTKDYEEDVERRNMLYETKRQL